MIGPIKLDLPEVLENGNYLICLEVQDASGNEYCEPVCIYKKGYINGKPKYRLFNNYPQVYYTIQTQNSINTHSYQKESGSSQILYPGCLVMAEYFDCVSSTWKSVLNNEKPDNIAGNIGDKNPVKTFNFDTGFVKNGYEDKFYRTSATECYVGYLNNNTNLNLKDLSDYVYKMTDTYYFATTHKDNNGNVVQPEGGYVVLDMSDNFVPICEQPCLMSTVYSKVKYGEDVDLWERNTTDAQHLNTRVVSNMEKYKPSDEVPVGCYYCVIVHYADGSSDISKIYKK